MIFLSQLILNPRDGAVRRDLADCQALHRTIMSAFPQVETDVDGARATYGVLFRLEPSPSAGGPPSVLVQSAAAPDWSKLPPGYLRDTAGDPPNPRIKRVDGRYASIVEGAQLRFRLRANPARKIDTKSGPGGERRNGRRVSIVGDAERLAWLQRKGADGGFRIIAARGYGDVPDVRASAGEPITGWHGSAVAKGKATQLTFGAVLFDGNLVVTDPARFQELLRHGVGSAKAYGFGLLSIGPARE